jgi:HEAT repeat protein
MVNPEDALVTPIPSPEVHDGTPPSPADVLRVALEDRDVRRSQAAARALAAQPPEAAPGLLEGLSAGLKHPEVLTRRRAAQLLGGLGLRAAPAIPALIEALGGPRWTAREAAALALGRAGAGSPLARDALLRCALYDRTPLVRGAAAQGLALLGAEVVGAVEGLRDACRHRHPRIRCRALQALGELAALSEDFPSLLAAALADSHAKVRRTVAALAGGLGPAALPLLPSLLRRRAAVESAARHREAVWLTAWLWKEVQRGACRGTRS